MTQVEALLLNFPARLLTTCDHSQYGITKLHILQIWQYLVIGKI